MIDDPRAPGEMRPIFYSNRGKSYRAKGDLDRAIADYSAAVELSPNAATLYLDCERSYLFSGNAGAALADLNGYAQSARNGLAERLLVTVTLH